MIQIHYRMHSFVWCKRESVNTRVQLSYAAQPALDAGRRWWWQPEGAEAELGQPGVARLQQQQVDGGRSAGGAEEQRRGGRDGVNHAGVDRARAGAPAHRQCVG